MASPLNPYDNLQTPYANLANRSSFAFWGQPVVTNSDGTLSCPGFVGPTYAASAWDKVFVAVPYSGSEQPYTPGQAEVSVHKSRDVDKKKFAGGDGARLTIHGLEPAIIEIRLLIWTPEQLLWLSKIWPVLFPAQQKVASIPNNSRPVTARQNVSTAFDVQHPALDLHGVKSMVFTGGVGPDQGPTPRSRVFTMRGLEFLPPVKNVNSTNTPPSSKGSLLDPGAYPASGLDPANLGPPT